MAILANEQDLAERWEKIFWMDKGGRGRKTRKEGEGSSTEEGAGGPGEGSDG
jgi:hypothetical protein